MQTRGFAPLRQLVLDALAGARPIYYLQNLAVLGGNDPHSYGVTSRRASMNTLGPKIGGDGWIRTTALFTGEIYSLVQSTTLPRLRNKCQATWFPPLALDASCYSDHSIYSHVCVQLEICLSDSEGLPR